MKNSTLVNLEGTDVLADFKFDAPTNAFDFDKEFLLYITNQFLLSYFPMETLVHKILGRGKR